MKKKSIIIIYILVVIIISIGVGCGYLILFNNKNIKIDNKESDRSKKETIIKKECIPFSGGSFNLIFDTGGGDELASMKICIACSPDSYKDIPIPTRNGYKFMGWFTDKEFTNRITFTNTKEFKSVPKYDKDNCVIGFEDITIHAKWEEDLPKEDNTIPKPL